MPLWTFHIEQGLRRDTGLELVFEVFAARDSRRRHGDERLHVLERVVVFFSPLFDVEIWDDMPTDVVDISLYVKFEFFIRYV